MIASLLPFGFGKGKKKKDKDGEEEEESGGFLSTLWMVLKLSVLVC